MSPGALQRHRTLHIDAIGFHNNWTFFHFIFLVVHGVFQNPLGFVCLFSVFFQTFTAIPSHSWTIQINSLNKGTLEKANKQTKRSSKADGSGLLVPGPKRRKARENKVFAYLHDLKGAKEQYTDTISKWFFCVSKTGQGDVVRWK